MFAYLCYDPYLCALTYVLGRDILTHAGRINHDAALRKAHEEYEKFRLRQISEPTEVEKHFIEAEQQLSGSKPLRGKRANMAKRKAKGLQNHTFQNKLVINQWVISFFGIDPLSKK